MTLRRRNVEFGAWSFGAVHPSKLSASHAFTLVELMVVMVLIGISTALIVPEMRGTYEDAVLRSSSRELVNVFHLSYSRAVSLNQAHRVRLDERTGKYFVEKKIRETERGDEYTRLKDVAGTEGELSNRISIRMGKPPEEPQTTSGAPEQPDQAQQPEVTNYEAPLEPFGPDEGIVFYPDGTADECEIRLRDRDGFRLGLKINPVTARIQVTELPRE